MAPMTKVIKGLSFQWNPKAQAAFAEVKVKLKLSQAPILALPCLTRSLKWNVMHPKLALEEF